MCMSKPKIPEPQTPQEVKEPETIAIARSKRKGVALAGAGTLLTGSAGVAPGSLNTGAPTLLGG